MKAALLKQETNWNTSTLPIKNSKEFETVKSQDFIIKRYAPKKDLAPNKTKVAVPAKNDTNDAYNPDNTKWFRKILKNHFDVDLEMATGEEDAHHHGGVKWKIRRVKNSRNTIRPRDDFEEQQIFDHASPKEFAFITNSAQFMKKTDSNFFKGGDKKQSIQGNGSNVSVQPVAKGNPALNNFVAKVR